jgi:hypothetical protein
MLAFLVLMLAFVSNEPSFQDFFIELSGCFPSLS